MVPKARGGRAAMSNILAYGERNETALNIQRRRIPKKQRVVRSKVTEGNKLELLES